MAPAAPLLALFLPLALSGCLATGPPAQADPVPGPLPAQCIIAGEHTAAVNDRCAEVPGAPGIWLGGTRFTWGQWHVAQVNATNLGDTTYWVKREDCGGKPWRDSMAGGGAEVQKDPSVATCSICSWREFAPGHSIQDSFEWDELVWDQDYHHRGAAPGAYTWTLRLDLQPSPGLCDAATATHADLVFTIDVA
jgi:hypothetical protein